MIKLFSQAILSQIIKQNFIKILIVEVFNKFYILSFNYIRKTKSLIFFFGLIKISYS